MRRLAAILAIVCAAVLGGTGTGHAVLPDEILDDPALEARARSITGELRCVVCQNQSIDDSNAEIARDMRLLVRDRLLAGDSDREVVDYVVARYGDFVRLRPPFQENTLALWLGPPVMAVVIAMIALLFFRSYQRRRHSSGSEPPALSPQDRAELDALVDRVAAHAPPSLHKSAFRAELDEPRPGPRTSQPDADAQDKDRNA